MIIKTVEQLNRYLADGGDPDRISIQKDPVPIIPSERSGTGDDIEGNHNYRLGIRKRRRKWNLYSHYLWKT